IDAVPGAMPETTPVLPTVATAVLLLLHVPPGVASVSVVVLPAQTVAVPVTDDGNAFTVTVAEAVQPPDVVYVIDAVPGAMPETTPVLPTVATAVLLLL